MDIHGRNKYGAHTHVCFYVIKVRVYRSLLVFLCVCESRARFTCGWKISWYPPLTIFLCPSQPICCFNIAFVHPQPKLEGPLPFVFNLIAADNTRAPDFFTCHVAGVEFCCARKTPRTNTLQFESLSCKCASHLCQKVHILQIKSGVVDTIFCSYLALADFCGCDYSNEKWQNESFGCGMGNCTIVCMKQGQSNELFDAVWF